MKVKTIKLRTKISLDSIKNHVKRLFVYFSNNLKSEYVSIQSHLVTNQNETISLGKTFIIDMESGDEKKYYNDYLTKSFLELKDLKLHKLNTIKFYYVETDKNEYDNFVKNILNANRDDKSSLIELNSLFKT